MKLTKLFTALLLSTAIAPVAFANTNAGSKLYVCATPQQTQLVQADYEALTWVAVGSIGNFGETGVSTNILSYNTWDTDVVQKAKGITDAGSPMIEVARVWNDPGQVILRNAAITNFNYAFKMVRNDPNSIGGTPSILYNRGLVTGPKRPNGKNEDFDLEQFTLALQQREIVVNPSAGGVPPEFQASPAITGTPKVGTVLTTSNGTVTGDALITYGYQWYTGGAIIPGANAITYTPTTADIGNIMTCRVIATNASGNATGFTPATAVVAA